MKNIFTAGILCFAVVVYAQPGKWFPDEKLITTGIYYYPEHWPEEQWEDDFKIIADIGFEWIHIGEFAWAFIEPNEGEFDFSLFDKVMAKAERYGLKTVMCTPSTAPAVWVTRDYPEILATDGKGQKTKHGARQHGSHYSKKYRELVAKYVERLAEKYKDDDRIVGWQIDNEPLSNLDEGVEATERFRAWLKQKYGTNHDFTKCLVSQGRETT